MARERGQDVSEATSRGRAPAGGAGASRARAAVLRLVPAVLSLAVLAAHFYRAGLVPLVPSCIGAIAMLFVRLPWVRRLAIGSLLLAAAEWARTLLTLAADRIAAGEPWLLLAIILGAVIIFTLAAACPFRSAPLRWWYSGAQASAAGSR